MRDSKVIQALAGVITAGSVVAIALTLHGGFLPGLEAAQHEAAGWAMARQAISLLKPGGHVMLLTRDTTEFKNPATDIQLSTFKKELRKAKVAISAEMALQVDPLRPMEVPPGDFLEWIRKSPEGSVIVSFMGPPVLSADQRRQLREIKPAVVAFCPGSWPDRISLQSLFDQGLLHAAVVSRRDLPSSAAKPRSRQAWFDQHFAVVTAANVGDVMALSENRLSAESR